MAARLRFTRAAMTPVRSSALALVDTSDAAAASDRERRAHVRLDPHELADPLIARVKYGEPLTLLDVSAGGARFETTAPLRPDSTLVLEVMAAGGQEAQSVVSRVVRCHVADVRGGIRYRGACAFKRPLEHPVLALPPTSLHAVPNHFARPELALKMIVEAYRRRAQGSRANGLRPDGVALIDSLRKLRDATEQRGDPTDRRVAQMLDAILPTLQRNESADDVISEVLLQMRRHVPAMLIRIGSGSRPGAAGDAERVTLNVWPEPVDRATLTAEFPTGFDVDEAHFRMLKTGAYLIGLADSWVPGVADSEPAPAAAPPDTHEEQAAELPAGWQRVVVRFVDGKLLRGYSNNFHPDAAHLHLCPAVNSPAAERLFVPIARLKAVFFVRDLAGKADHIDSNDFDHAPRARKVEATFRDGEVMTGSTLNYKPHAQGFFLTPANSRGNNQRVYVVLAAVRHLRFL